MRPERAVVRPCRVSNRDRNKAGSCVVFLDTPSTVDDRRYLQARGRFSQVCAGDCGQDVKPGARTFQFLRDGTLPPL
jgi:hypothetical protein